MARTSANQWAARVGLPPTYPTGTTVIPDAFGPPLAADVDPEHDQRLSREVFADAVARYNRDRTAAFAEYRGATDRAWQDYLRAARAAELEYDQAVTRAGNHYDTEMAHLA